MPTKRIHTIGGGVAASTSTAPPPTAATVHIGPDYGTTNKKVELHLDHVSESPRYPMTEELSVRPTTFTQSYTGPTEELHVGFTPGFLHPMEAEELSLRHVSESPRYPMTEELSLRPTTFTQAYSVTEELDISVVQKTSYRLPAEELHIDQTQMPQFPMTEELSLRPTSFRVNYPMTEELSLRPSVFRQSYPMEEELHIGPETHIQSYAPMTEELDIGASTFRSQFSVIEELLLRPTTFTASYRMTEELDISMAQRQSYTGPIEELHFTSATERPAYRVTEELHISGTVKGPPQFEAAVVQASSNSSAIVFTGVTTIVGMMLLAHVALTASTGAFTSPAGWTSVISKFNAGELAVFSHAVVAGDPSTWTFNSGGSAAVAIGAILSFSAADLVTPVNATAASTGNSTVLTTPVTTVTKTNTMTVGSGFQSLAGVTTANFAVGAPYIQRVAQATVGLLASGNLEVCTHVQASSGASLAATINTGELLGLGGAWQTITVALNSTLRVIA